MNIEDYISSGVIEAYVMGLATEEEAQILECVQKNNASVKQAVLDAQETLGRLHQAQAVAPPAHLKTSIWAKIQKEENLTSHEEDTQSKNEVIDFQPKSEKNEVLDFHPTYIKSKTKEPVFYWAAAASVLLVISLGYFLLNQQKMTNELATLKSKQETSEKNYATLNEKWLLSTNPGIKTVALAGVEKHSDSRALIYLNSTTKKTYLSLENLPKAPTGYQYQLWGLVDGTPVNAGVFTQSDDKKVQEMLAVVNAQAYAITLEKEGGSSVPTLENMYVMGSI